MKNPVTIAHDVGTSATKTVIVTAGGEVLASESTAHRTHVTGHNGFEQGAEEWWHGVCRNTRALLAARPELGSLICAVGVTGQMLGCLPVDDDGRPLRRSMIHADSRAQVECETVDRTVGRRRLYEITGNILDPRSTLCKLLWIKRNEPEIYRRTARFLQSKDYVVFRLTGRIDTCDYTDAAHAQLVDIVSLRYADEVLQALGIDRAKLPALSRAVEVVGRVTDAAADETGLAAGLPVVAGGGDGACATVGAGVREPGAAYCSLGSTAWIGCASARPLIDPEIRVFSLPPLDRIDYTLYGTVQTAGTAIRWASGLFGGESSDSVDMIAGRAEPASGPLFLPFLEGERSPIWDPHARGVFFGLRPGHGRSQMLRAVVEGVCCALRSVLEVFRERYAIEELRVVGGGVTSTLWTQILADTCRVELQPVGDTPNDRTAVGAAMVAATGAGLHDSLDAAMRTVGIARTIAFDPRTAPVYERTFELYESLYPALKDVFSQLASLTSGRQ